MYGLKSDPRSGFFFWSNSRCGAERISVLAKTHGLLRSGFSALTTTRIGAERIIRTNCCHGLERICPRLSRSGSDRISARGKCHGLSRSEYPPSKIHGSVKRIFHGADYLTPSNKPHTPWDLSTVHGSNNPLNVPGKRLSADKYHERRQQRNNDDKQYE